jgi:hypothetical protein
MQQANGFDKVVPYDEDVNQRLAELPGPKPRDAPCPLCGAAIGVECTTRTGYSARTHAPRWRAVGVSKPSDEDRSRDHLDGERRRLETIKALYRTPAWLTRDGATQPENRASTT